MRFTGVILLLIVALMAAPAAAQPVVGVLGIPSEITPVEQRLKDSGSVTVNGQVFRVGTLGGRRVVVGRSGAGKVNAAIVATLLIGHFAPAALFFSGTAGAIDQSLYPGDVVIGTAVAQHDTGVLTANGLGRQGLRNQATGEKDPLLVHAPALLVTAARQAAAALRLPAMDSTSGGRMPRIVEGVIVTGDVFVSDTGRRDELRTSLGASVVEMEGAAVVQACRQFNVACLVVRSVSDRADGQAAGSYANFRAVASENAAAVVAAIIARLDRER